MGHLAAEIRKQLPRLEESELAVPVEGDDRAPGRRFPLPRWHPVRLTGGGSAPTTIYLGMWGYASLLEVLADPDHEERQDLLEWLGLESADEFGPTT